MKIGIIKRKSRAAVSFETLRAFYTYCLALLPILFVYNVPSVNVSLGTVFLFAFLPYSVIVILRNLKGINRGSVLILLLFYAYFIIRSKGSIRAMLLYFAACVQLVGIVEGAVDARKLRSAMETVAIISAVIVFAQVLSHYLLGKKLDFVVLSALQRDYKAIYSEPALSGGLYRPTGPFLEPAMLSEYCVFALVSCLFSADGSYNKRKAAIIAAGIVLTTSGIGIVLTAGVIGWFLLLRRQSLDKRVKNVLKGLLLLAAVLLIMSRFAFFKAALARIFTNYDGYNAVRGRVWRWAQALKPMKGAVLLFGYGATADFPAYLTGIADTIYRCGVVGMLLEFLLLFDMMRKKRSQYVLLSCLIFILLLFFAKLTSVFYQVFYFGLILTEVYAKESKSGEYGEAIKDGLPSVG